MATRFDADTDRISYAGSVPDPASGFTLTAWAFLSVDRNDNSTFARLFAGSTTATLATDTNGTDGPAYFTAGGSLVATTDFVVGEWRKVAYSCTGTAGKVYAATPAGATEVVSGTVVGAASPTGITLGGRSPSDATEWFNGRLAYVRVWSAVLSQAQIEAEWVSATPVVTTNLFADWPLADASDLTDHFGDHDLVAGSTAVTTEDGPPVNTGITGSGGGTVPAAAGTGAGEVVAAGTGSGSAPPSTGSGAGAAQISGVAGGSVPPATGAGVGVVPIGGDGAGLAPLAIGAGLGGVLVTGSGAGSVPAATGTGHGGDPAEEVPGAGDPRLTVRPNGAVLTVTANRAVLTLGEPT